MTKPPFTYFGGKTAIAPRIAALLPPHEHYVEPFAGSLAVLLAKPRSRMETVNDLDGDIPTFDGNAARERRRTEVLWSNRPFPQASLFDRQEAAVT